MKRNRKLPIGGGIIIPGLPGQIIPPWLKPPYDGNLPGFPKPPNNENNDIFMNIKSVVEDKFVVVGPNNRLYATSEKANNSQVFRLVMQKGNNAKLRIKGGSFIRLDNNDMLIADTDNKGATIFKIYQTGQNEYVLMAPNGLYVRVRDNDKVLIARAESTGPRTRFKFRQVNN